MSDSIVTGNAAEDSAPFRSWFVGSFIPPELGLRSTEAVEVKWGTHDEGEVRPDWGVSTNATSLSLLVRGSIRLFFATGEEVVLDQAGDYAMWAPGVAHRWRIEEDRTVILTVRWPSRPEHAG